MTGFRTTEFLRVSVRGGEFSTASSSRVRVEYFRIRTRIRRGKCLGIFFDGKKAGADPASQEKLLRVLITPIT